ncbi:MULTISPECIES: hypothetical protein [Mycolicibacterium]|uniref:VirB8 protein n=2 Tax=unclassified Mycobacterium TaxID=2642494 RepID=A0A5Q5BN52_MYCSS|nr:hypothetical protein [Mycolicibacterium monacense]OBB71442.1 hypothetical protein A6B34_16760 [Mycolicibacterium monacense]OBF52934.1 hypothetical protein A5778_12335 [Mycolicibacterium monacense]
MPSFRRRASVLDADRVAAPAQEPARDADNADVLARAEEAEAEAAEAEAAAVAARARARAIRLRREAAAASASSANGEPEESDESVTETAAVAEPEVESTTAPETDGDEVSSKPDKKRGARRRPRLRLPRLTWKRLAVTIAVLVICASLAASGYMLWHHRQAVAEREQRAEYAAAARQGVVTLMSLDFNKAQEDVKRIIDNSTGQFKEDFEQQAEAFAEVAQDSKVVTEVNVNLAAVKSMTDDSASVLVSATSRVTNAAGAKQEPRAWRLAVELSREGDQIKMSKVEFVP